MGLMYSVKVKVRIAFEGNVLDPLMSSECSGLAGRLLSRRPQR